MVQTLNKEFQMIFLASDANICNGYMKYHIRTSTFHVRFCVQALPFSIAIAYCPKVQNNIYNCLIIMFTTSWRNLNKIGWSELHKMWCFMTKSRLPCKPFLTYRWRHFERVFCKWKKKDANVYITKLIFYYSKRSGSLTQEIRLKVQ